MYHPTIFAMCYIWITSLLVFLGYGSGPFRFSKSTSLTAIQNFLSNFLICAFWPILLPLYCLSLILPQKVPPSQEIATRYKRNG